MRKIQSVRRHVAGPVGESEFCRSWGLFSTLPHPKGWATDPSRFAKAGARRRRRHLIVGYVIFLACFDSFCPEGDWFPEGRLLVVFRVSLSMNVYACVGFVVVFVFSIPIVVFVFARTKRKCQNMPSRGSLGCHLGPFMAHVDFQRVERSMMWFRTPPANRRKYALHPRSK